MILIKLKNIKIYTTEIFKKDNFYKTIFESIENKTYTILKILKDDQRSKVLLIEINNKNYIYKIPIEKNKRKWQKFLSIFRKSESYRNFKDTKKIINNKFYAPKPIIAVEKTGLLNSVKDSYFIMEYIDGYIPKKDDIRLVVDILNKIHEKKFLHGDSQTTNFIISNDSKKVYILDAKFNKNFYGNFGKMYEFIYLEKNFIDFYNEPLNLYDKNNFYYKICKSIDNYFENYSKFKKKLKNFIRNKKYV